MTRMISSSSTGQIGGDRRRCDGLRRQSNGIDAKDSKHLGRCKHGNYLGRSKTGKHWENQRLALRHFRLRLRKTAHYLRRSEMYINYFALVVRRTGRLLKHDTLAFNTTGINARLSTLSIRKRRTGLGSSSGTLSLSTSSTLLLRLLVSRS